MRDGVLDARETEHALAQESLGHYKIIQNNNKVLLLFLQYCQLTVEIASPYLADDSTLVSSVPGKSHLPSAARQTLFVPLIQTVLGTSMCGNQ